MKPLIPRADAFIIMLQGEKAGMWLLQKGSMQCAITSYGARVVSLIVPDKYGNATDVALGYNSLDEFITASDDFYGAIVGRYANRIANGRFALDGRQYELPINNGPNTLHGGPGGFHARVWTVTQEAANSLTLHYLSKDGDEGFPGDLDVTITYSLEDDNILQIKYAATAAAPTVINLSNHTYFNLNGEGSGSIEDHAVLINATHYTPVNETLIPTGEIASVKNTPFDFTAAHSIGAYINDDDAQLSYGGGYDHNFVLDSNKNMPAAIVTGDISGIIMELYTDQPGMQFYSGNSMKGIDTGKSGRIYKKRDAFVLEPQHYPDCPNQPAFPDTTLRSAPFTSVSRYKFMHK